MELQAYLNQEHQLWEPFDFTGRKLVEVSEIWSQANPENSNLIHHHEIHQENLRAWISDTDSRTQSGQDHEKQDRTCLVRVVWITRLTKQRLDDTSVDIIGQLVSSFQQELAHGCFKTTFAGAACLGKSEQDAYSHCFSIHPKLSMTWSQLKNSHTTSVICVAEQLKIDKLKQLLNFDFVQAAASHPMMPALICAILCSREIDEAHQLVKQQVRKVEVRTGHHGWDSRVEMPATGDLVSLSAAMSGCSTKIASSIRKAKVLAQLIEKFGPGDRCTECNTMKSSIAADDGGQTFCRHVSILRQRAISQSTDASFIESRVQAQLSALFHLTAEDDAAVNRKMALDSRLLAAATQRDSSSMKVLAVVTMFFLPGTFMSSLLSIPLFDLSGTSTGIMGVTGWKSALALYTAVTIPLTLLTFLTWFLCATLRKKRQTRQETDHNHHASLRSVQMSEVASLALKRSATSMAEKMV